MTRGGQRGKRSRGGGWLAGWVNVPGGLRGSLGLRAAEGGGRGVGAEGAAVQQLGRGEAAGLEGARVGPGAELGRGRRRSGPSSRPALLADELPGRAEGGREGWRFARKGLWAGRGLAGTEGLGGPAVTRPRGSGGWNPGSESAPFASSASAKVGEERKEGSPARTES